MVSTSDIEARSRTVRRSRFDNVVSAFERERDGAPFHWTGRTTVVAVIARNVLAVLPGADGNALAAACNRGLDDAVGAIGLDGPRVEAVDIADGSITML